MTYPKSLLRQAIENDIANKKYNPMNDILFKFIFGKEERKHVTIDFLNAVLDRHGAKAIKDIQFQNSEIVPLYEDDKLTRLDIFCVTEDGTQIDVEIQIVDKKNMERRTLYYWSQMYLMNLAKGGKYQNLKPSITINILRYTIFPGEPAHSMYSIYNKETGRRLNEDMELHFLEVPKFQKKPVSEMTSVERWLAYFSNKLDLKEMEELAMNEAAIQTALDAAAVFMQNKQERLNYLNREMAIMDYESDKDAWIDAGRAEGLAEGRVEGEKNADRRTAKRMLAKNKSIDEILELVDLTREEIEEIAHDIRL
ncbi:Rpn family recombination-promoting nuclease/putative transposase [Selenomonas ruminantium]|uniref:Rpn family recombination-promoting nuclease/putative transposase n=1 Tax=Selenomonas ruminantium TaxID=971 RepID=UPI0026EEA5DB|nr:Rpn family recombination-promoting nuclease/putative transposase [Selenomonas ruminantium]